MANGRKTGGRKPGSTNKVLGEAKAAIGMFVDGNVHRLEGWLDAVANGDPEHDIRPNPAKAFELFQSVVEYHIPKLGRTVLAGDAENPVKVELDIVDAAKRIAFVLALAEDKI